jgi:hypothetical protein
LTGRRINKINGFPCEEAMNDQRTSDVIRAVSVPLIRQLTVAETQLARLAADGDEASAKALWPYVKREMGR